MRSVRLLLLSLLCLAAAPSRAFDAGHAAWTALLERHVRWNAEGTATTVDYAGFARERAALAQYLDTLSAVPRGDFERWPRAERIAFLINAYNAFTVELILTAWPRLESIRDLGSLLRSPWRRRFFTLLGAERHLDELEHDLLRGAPDFDEPRIHFAVNCASIGCPALRPEAYRAADLDAQLEDQTRRFLGDRSRNRYDAAREVLAVSRIFDWYRKDFERGLGGIESLAAFFARYAELLADTPALRARVAAGTAPITFLDYDWGLNASASRPSP